MRIPAMLVVIAVAGCSRTSLRQRPSHDPVPDHDAAWDEDAGLDATVPVVPCEPEQERCDGLDNDCNGQVDDGLAPEPCDAGGFRFCVGGAMSVCPRACDVCRPGARRVCFPSYCTRWGEQVCEADGLAWGRCRELPAPADCKGEPDTWDAADDSPATGRCCQDRGDCCKDHWDLDGDGDTDESLGDCESVTCDG